MRSSPPPENMRRTTCPEGLQNFRYIAWRLTLLEIWTRHHGSWPARPGGNGTSLRSSGKLVTERSSHLVGGPGLARWLMPWILQRALARWWNPWIGKQRSGSEKSQCQRQRELEAAGAAKNAANNIWQGPYFTVESPTSAGWTLGFKRSGGGSTRSS